jgi:hypothetical protein
MTLSCNRSDCSRCIIDFCIVEEPVIHTIEEWEEVPVIKHKLVRKTKRISVEKYKTEVCSRQVMKEVSAREPCEVRRS